jgi:KUP system potassium uptake protein
VAVTTTMLITTLLAYVVARKVWGWSAWLAGAVTGVFLVMDLAFFGANIVKVATGGWFALVVAAAVFLVMTTWERGRELLAGKLRQRILPVETLLRDIERRSPHRVAGTAVFLAGDSAGTPIGFLHNLKHNKVIHNHNLFLTVRGEEVPYVPAGERLEVSELGLGFYRVLVRYGFMEDPDIPAALARAREGGLKVDPQGATYILSRNLLSPARRRALPGWRHRLFMFLARNAHSPAQFYRLPPNRVVELGMQVEI